MPNQLQFAQLAAGALVNSFHQTGAGDRVCIGTFGSSYSLVQSFTDSEAEFHQSLFRLTADGGMTRFRDSICDFVNYFRARARRDRPWLIIVITDGDDNRSTNSSGAVGALLRAAFTNEDTNFMFTIGVGNNINQAALKTLAAQGGYSHTGLDSFEELAVMFQLIGLQVMQSVTGVVMSDGKDVVAALEESKSLVRMGIDYGFLIDVSSSMSTEVSGGGRGRPAPTRYSLSPPRRHDPQPSCNCIIL